MSLKGATLLELIIVMGILAAIMGLGVYGLIKFQGTVELQSVYSEFVANLKTLQNKAKNSINTSSTNDKAPFIYAIIFDQNTYTFYSCDKATSSTLLCVEDSSIPEVDTSSKGVLISNPGCNGMGFSRLTGDIVSINITNFTFNSVGQCNYTLLHNNSQLSNSITVNLTNNSIDTQ